MQDLARMQQGRLKIVAELEAWWQEFRTYRRDAQGRVVKRHDHLMDATRYLVTTGLLCARTQQGQLKPRPVADWRTV